MNTTIPAGPISDFVDSTNRHDADALLAVFTTDATVTDDGTTFTGSTEIQQWIQHHLITPRITLNPASYTQDDASTAELTASADGEFPGGPLPFAFRFFLDGGRITSLRIGLEN